MQTTVADEIPALEATAGDRKGEPQVLPEAAVLALLRQTMDLALECHRGRNLEQAEELYRAVLSLDGLHRSV